MEPIPTKETVLVTGVSGHLGSWVAIKLLQAGYKVNGTIRHLRRAGEVEQSIYRQIPAANRLALFAADLQRDGGWEEAASGCSYAIHVASPMPIGEYKAQDLITPAREGTRRVLEAAQHAGLKRVVLTSSASAALPALGSADRLTEANWTSRPDKPIYQYPRSKVLAEQDAWSFVQQHAPDLQLVTILPGLIQGPIIGAHPSAGGIVGMMLSGKMPAVPRVGFTVVDVRDLADLHIDALTSPAAAGQRVLAGGEFLWLKDIADILHDHFGAKAAKVPTRVLPDAVVRLLGFVSKDMAQLAPDLGVMQGIDASKARDLFGWTTRSGKQSIIDGANSVLSSS
jgi:dihydroflavonol-4-reductase